MIRNLLKHLLGRLHQALIHLDLHQRFLTGTRSVGVPWPALTSHSPKMKMRGTKLSSNVSCPTNFMVPGTTTPVSLYSYVASRPAVLASIFTDRFNRLFLHRIFSRALVSAGDGYSSFWLSAARTIQLQWGALGAVHVMTFNAS